MSSMYEPVITLCVQDYCNGCPEFSPEVNRFYCDDIPYNQTVVCVHRIRCKAIYKHILEKVEDTGDEIE